MSLQDDFIYDSSSLETLTPEQYFTKHGDYIKKWIHGFEGLYLIYGNGKVFSFYFNKFLKNSYFLA